MFVVKGSFWVGRPTEHNPLPQLPSSTGSVNGGWDSRLASLVRIHPMAKTSNLVCVPSIILAGLKGVAYNDLPATISQTTPYFFNGQPPKALDGGIPNLACYIKIQQCDACENFINHHFGGLNQLPSG